MQITENFGFLSIHDAKLTQLAVLAERYFRDDPSTAIVKLRQFAELLSKLIAAHHALYLGERETFEERLRRLSYERIIPKETADVFHALRKAGNNAVHEARGSHSDALSALKFARQLGIWFHRTYGKQPDFMPGAFIPPEPADAAAAFNQVIPSPVLKVAEIGDAARANYEVERNASERAESWLAQTMLNSTISEGLASDIQSEEAEIAARLAALQSAAEQAPKAEAVEFQLRGQEASTKIDLDEAATRALIDQQLQDSGWEADTKAFRYAAGVRPAKGRNLAIAEWPTKSGPADYALFTGLALVGVVEAKRKRKNVSAAIDQAERYSVGLAGSGDFTFSGGPWRPIGPLRFCRERPLVSQTDRNRKRHLVPGHAPRHQPSPCAC